jgi:hypothetical protein
MASSRLQRLQALVQADLEALPDVSSDSSEDEAEIEETNAADRDPATNQQITSQPSDEANQPHTIFETPTAINTDRLAECGNEEDGDRISTSRDAEAFAETNGIVSDSEDSEAGYEMTIEQIDGVSADEHEITDESTPEIDDLNAFASVTGLAMKPGQLGPSKLAYCPIIAVSKLPYKWLRDEDPEEKIADRFFNAGKFWHRPWDL